MNTPTLTIALIAVAAIAALALVAPPATTVMGMAALLGPPLSADSARALRAPAPTTLSATEQHPGT